MIGWTLLFKLILGLLQMRPDATVLTIDAGAATARAGHEYVVAIDPAAGRSGLYHAPSSFAVTVLENGAPLGPAEADHAIIAATGGGAFAHARKLVYFSTSDNTDPRTNGRRYTLRATPTAQRIGGAQWSVRIATLSLGWVAPASQSVVGPGVLVLALLAGALWVIARAAPAGRPERDDGAVRRGLVGAAVPAAVSAAILCWLPPSWNGTDSAVLLRGGIDIIPHFPPLYLTLMFLFDQAMAPAQSLWLMVLLQHALSIAAIGYLAAAQPRAAGALAVAAAATFGAALNLYAHGMFLEGLATPLMIAAIGATIRIAQGRAVRATLLIGFGALFLGATTRHNSQIFFALPCVAAALLVLFGSDRRRAARLLVGTIAAGVLSIAAAGQLNDFYCAGHSRACTSILGRAGVYRMVAAAKPLDPAAGRRFVTDLQARADDDTTKRAIQIMINIGDPWVTTYHALDADPAMHALGADAVMNRAFLVFATAPLAPVWSQYLEQLDRFAEPAGYWLPVRSTGGAEVGQVTSIAYDALGSMTLFAARPANFTTISDFMIPRAVAYERYRWWTDPPGLAQLDAVSPAFLGVTGLIGLALLRLAGYRRPDVAIATLALVATGALYAVLTAFATVMLFRYVAPCWLCGWVACALVAVALVEEIARRIAAARSSFDVRPKPIVRG